MLPFGMEHTGMIFFYYYQRHLHLNCLWLSPKSPQRTLPQGPEGEIMLFCNLFSLSWIELCYVRLVYYIHSSINEEDFVSYIFLDSFIMTMEFRNVTPITQPREYIFKVCADWIVLLCKSFTRIRQKTRPGSDPNFSRNIYFSCLLKFFLNILEILTL